MFFLGRIAPTHIFHLSQFECFVGNNGLVGTRIKRMIKMQIFLEIIDLISEVGLLDF